MRAGSALRTRTVAVATLLVMFVAMRGGRPNVFGHLGRKRPRVSSRFANVFQPVQSRGKGRERQIAHRETGDGKSITKTREHGSTLQLFAGETAFIVATALQQDKMSNAASQKVIQDQLW